MATLRETAKGVVVGDTGKQTYRIGFNGGDETELDKLWSSLCPEFGRPRNSVDYVERM